MKAFIPVVPNVLASLGRVPLYLVVPATMGLTMFGMSELGIDINHSLRSASIFGGQAAQGDAQGADAPKTREALRDNKPLSNAGALLGTQINAQDAAAKKTYAEVPQITQAGIAASESLEAIMYKKTHGMPISSTEELLLLDAETKTAERDKARAEASIKGQVANLLGNDFGSGSHADAAFDRSFAQTFPSAAPVPKAAEQSSGYNPVGVIGRMLGQPAAPAPKVAVVPPVAQPLPPVVVAPPAYYNYAYNYPIPPQRRVMRPVAPGVGFFNRRPLPRFFNPAARPQPITGFPLAGRY